MSERRGCRRSTGNQHRETLLRALVNDKARAVLLAFAVGTDLDHIGALVGLERAVVAPATNEAPVIMETDDRLRRRIQLALEAFSVAGPAGAYEFHALAVDPSILDAYAYSRREGEVQVIVIGQNVEPVSDELMTKLVRKFKLGDVVPLTDSVDVRRARRPVRPRDRGEHNKRRGHRRGLLVD